MTTPTQPQEATTQPLDDLAKLTTQELLLAYRKMRFGRGTAFGASLKESDTYLEEANRRDAALASLLQKIAYYEAPLPMGENGKYTITCDHRFTDEGLCIRCGEDAEEWDAGCVESIVNDMKELEDTIASLRRQLDEREAQLELRQGGA